MTKKIPDIGSIFVIGIVFIVIFSFIQIAADKLHYPFSVFIFGFITAGVALYWPRVKEEKSNLSEDKTNKDEVFVIGTNRKRTKLDDDLDKIILDKYYEKNGGERTPERDIEILKDTYLKKAS